MSMKALLTHCDSLFFCIACPIIESHIPCEFIVAVMMSSMIIMMSPMMSMSMMNVDMTQRGRESLALITADVCASGVSLCVFRLAAAAAPLTEKKTEK